MTTVEFAKYPSWKKPSSRQSWAALRTCLRLTSGPWPSAGPRRGQREGSFRPDDLVLRSGLQELLNRYAAFAGLEQGADKLFIEPDNVIMGEDAQIIFDDFFARLKAALADVARKPS